MQDIQWFPRGLDRGIIHNLPGMQGLWFCHSDRGICLKLAVGLAINLLGLVCDAASGSRITFVERLGCCVPASLVGLR